jgi:hypothetical protein
MGLLKNSYFLDLQEREAERERMELARREQQYINSRRANNANTKPGQKAHNTKAK